MSPVNEQTVLMDCEGETLVGILHRPLAGLQPLGVVIVVGGPQYRVGSHRQFVLTARRLAAAGVSVLRFDYRGMGDSSGALHTFERVNADIAAAVNTLQRQVPTLAGVVLWGLCDAASAVLMYGATDARIKGLVIANPWVRSPEGEARSYLKHYYGRRLLQRSFWKKVLRGEFNPVRSFAGLVGTTLRARANPAAGHSPAGDFRERMLQGFSGFAGPILLLLSERDLTAREFEDLCIADDRWRVALGRRVVRQERIADADHTFSIREHLDRADAATLQWLQREVLPDGHQAAGAAAASAGAA